METVNDIIKEMKNWDFHSHLDGCGHAELSCYADRLDAAYKRDLKSIVDAGEIDMRTAMDEVTRLREENKRLKAALKEAIPWACLKCTFWDSRRARCSRGSGMCDQVWKWKTILGEAAK